MGLTVAIIAHNYECSCNTIKEIAENDMDSKVKNVRRDEIIMEDSTKYKAFPTYSHLRGCRIDQAIIVSDIWNEYKHKIYEELKCRLEYTSYVPEEYQIQKI